MQRHGVKKSLAIIGGLLTLLALVVGVWIGWTVREMFAYDNCLDRINYDKALWHLCDAKEPRDLR